MVTEIRKIGIDKFTITPTCAPVCSYCGQDIRDLDLIELFNIYNYETYLHRNCVVAFATRILNEFEKL